MQQIVGLQLIHVYSYLYGDVSLMVSSERAKNCKMKQQKPAFESNVKRVSLSLYTFNCIYARRNCA